MRLLLGLPLLLIGLVVGALGIAQQTVWAPPEYNEVTQTIDQKAPVVVLDSAIGKVSEGNVDVQIKGEGDMVLAIGRSSDVKAWVGPAANYTYTGIEDKTLQGKFTEGEASTPNPRGSDLWVKQEEGTNTLEYRWEEFPPGDWSVLVATDGTAPAPSQLTVRYANTDTNPWAIPLIIIGGLIALLGIGLMFLTGRGKNKEPNEGTRAWEKAHTGPLTKIPAPAAAGAGAGKSSPVKSPGDESANKPGSKPGDTDTETVGTEKVGTEKVGTEKVGTDKTGTDKTSTDKTGTDKPNTTADASGTKPSDTPAPKPAGEAAGSSEVPSPKPASGNTRPKMTEMFGALGKRARGVVVLLVALSLVTPAGAANAETATEPAPTDSASVAPTPTTTDDTPGADDGSTFPLITDTQLKSILASAEEVAARGDSEKNVQTIAPRFAGVAYYMRKANYEVGAKVEGTVPLAPIAAERLLSYNIPVTDGGEQSWPRSFVAVTQGENNTVPQIILFRQESARDNYKIIESVPMLPGGVFPKPNLDSLGANGLDPASAEGLAMSPNEAINTLAGRLNDPAGDQKDSIEGNQYLDFVDKTRQDRIDGSTNDEGEAVSEVSIQHAPPGNEVYAYSTSDGGAVVIGYLNYLMTTTPVNRSTLQFQNYQEILGTESTNQPLEEFFGESVALYVPPAGSKDPLKLFAATQELLRVRILDQ